MDGGDEKENNAIYGGVAQDESWTLTASGRKMMFLQPTTESVCLLDITLHLSQICRFTGGSSQFYSVAQHSVFVAALVKQALDNESVSNQTVEYWDQILAALFHDAEEAYMSDISSPLKSCIEGKYNWIAEGIRLKIYERYGIDSGYYNATVKAADNAAVLVERYYLMPDHPDWPKVPRSEMTYARPIFMGPEDARWRFIDAIEMALKMRDALRRESCTLQASS